MRLARFKVTLRVAAVLQFIGSLSQLQAASMSKPTKIAVFRFELDDFSAAASTGAAPDTSSALTDCTKEVAKLLNSSGRYDAFVVDEAKIPAAQKYDLRDCGKCAADIAREAGAGEAILGVITKVSMTEFRVQIQTRNADTGEIIKTLKTDLRVGAYYAWSRGARSVIKSQMLTEQ